MMRPWRLGAAFLLTGILIGSNGLNPCQAIAQEGGKNAAEKESKDASIENEALLLHGKRFVLPGKRDDFVMLLGKPSRESHLANTILTWDDLGILIYVHPKSDTVHAVTIALAKKEYAFWPTKTFAGKVTVDGVEIKNNSELAQINRAKTGKKFEQDQGFKDWWTIKHDDIAHYLEQTKEKGISYVSVNVRIK